PGGAFAPALARLRPCRLHRRGPVLRSERIPPLPALPRGWRGRQAGRGTRLRAPACTPHPSPVLARGRRRDGAHGEAPRRASLGRPVPPVPALVRGRPDSAQTVRQRLVEPRHRGTVLPAPSPPAPLPALPTRPADRSDPPRRLRRRLRRDGAERPLRAERRRPDGPDELGVRARPALRRGRGGRSPLSPVRRAHP